jgi:hypothetical protein
MRAKPCYTALLAAWRPVLAKPVQRETDVLDVELHVMSVQAGLKFCLKFLILGGIDWPESGK